MLSAHTPFLAGESCRPYGAGLKCSGDVKAPGDTIPILIEGSRYEFFFFLRPHASHMFKVIQGGILDGGEAHHRPNIFMFSERYDSGPKRIGEEYNQKGQFRSDNTDHPTWEDVRRRPQPASAFQHTHTPRRLG